MRKRLSIPLLLSALLLLYTMLAPTPRLISEKAPPPTNARAPDSYARNVTLSDFDKTGSLSGRTTAQALRRFPAEGIVELDEPQRHNYADDAAWIANARSGRLREAAEVLALDGDVSLQYIGNSVKFLTDSMTINIPKQIARSTTNVRIWQADNETLAEQMYVNLDRQVAVLSGSVRARYVPEN